MISTIFGTWTQVDMCALQIFIIIIIIIITLRSSC